MFDHLLNGVLVALISYVLGAIPTAYVIARLKKVNIFEVGSGNMGATNVSRALGMSWGIVVWVLDMAKGIVAILIARQILSDVPATAAALAAIVCIVGHNWSIFAAMLTGKLRGGKGASIWFGTLIIIAPGVLLGISLIGSLILLVTRYVSLAVLVMFAVATLWIFVLVSQHAMPQEYTYYSVLVSALIVYRFRENIERLLRGTERRLGERI
ncbi:MAG: glycerol-3-phosphate acyltransferase [Anaerolineae bacterium]|jgi:glycerol-3-phosphate acyltransferase PlsY|nr:glycerol-3-phosphate acyltransferase [Anaerolineae bacterium]